jgi:hypothetical protein
VLPTVRESRVKAIPFKRLQLHDGAVLAAKEKSMPTVFADCTSARHASPRDLFGDPHDGPRIFSSLIHVTGRCRERGRVRLGGFSFHEAASECARQAVLAGFTRVRLVQRVFSEEVL